MASANNSNSSNKRRRLADDASLGGVVCLSDLPAERLTHIASFLVPPSRALFVAALDDPKLEFNESFSDIFPGNKLLGSGGTLRFRDISAQLAESHVQSILLAIEALDQSDTLDFGEINKEHVVQLSDDGMNAILLCIDAVNNVRRLRLANCINITGIGLESLRGSTFIEQIDLSLVGKHQSPILNPEPLISCEFVLPILDSIIAIGGCSLKHLQFPIKWRNLNMYQHGLQLQQFLTRYDALMGRRRVRVSCLNCSYDLPINGGSWMEINCIGTQNYTCYECLNHYCGECVDINDDNDMLDYCHKCERQYCKQCGIIEWCGGCEGQFCVGCTAFTDCSGCDESIFCNHCATSHYGNAKCFKCKRLFCMENCEDSLEHWCNCCNIFFCNDCEDIWAPDRYGCEHCGIHFCESCNEKEGVNGANRCDQCHERYCASCRVDRYQKGQSCSGCIKLVAPLLDTLEDNEKATLGKRDELIGEMKELEGEVKGLEDQNDALKKKMKELEEDLNN